MITSVLVPIALITMDATAEVDATDKIVAEGLVRIEENQQAQKRVSSIHDDTLSLIDTYQEKLKVVEGLNAYNEMMKRQVQRQLRDMDALRNSIDNVSIIERQVLPLLSRMLDGLEAFLRLDVPFHLEERHKRIANLRDMLERVDVTVAEKARRVFEAYQIEVEFGRTIEAYRNKLTLDGRTYDVDFLRIGRVSLLYRTVGDGQMGHWNNSSRQWQRLESSAYGRHFEQGLKIARREMAPELINAPVVLSGDIK